MAQPWLNTGNFDANYARLCQRCISARKTLRSIRFSSSAHQVPSSFDPITLELQLRRRRANYFVTIAFIAKALD